MLACDRFASTATQAALQRAFGSRDVAPDSVPLGDTEGDLLPATAFFPHDASRRIAIVWRDTAARRSPRFVYLYRRPTAWRTEGGVAVGMTLRDLERLNGRPFMLVGFGSDGEGTVVSWNGGRLATHVGSRCETRVQFEASGSHHASRAEWARVTGERSFSSSDPAMRAIGPRVSTIVVTVH